MAEISDRRRASTYRSVLARPAFRVLFLTRTLAVTGDAVRALALAVSVFAATGSPLLSAVAYSITFVPQMLGSSFLGTLADRLRPRPLLATLFAMDASAGLIIGLGHPPVAVSLVLVATVALVTPLYQGASSRLVADVLSGDDYVKGRALWCSAPLAAQLVGNALAGFSVAAFGAETTIVISAAFHIASVLMIRLGLPDFPSAPAPGGALVPQRRLSMFAESWRQNFQLLGTPSVRTLMLAKWIPPGLVTGAEALIVPYTAQNGYSASAAGVLLACLAVGMMVSNLLFGRVTDARLRDRLTLWLPLVAGLPLIALVFNLPVVITGAFLLLSGIGLAYDLGLELRFVDSIPDGKRGLAFGLRSTGLMTVQGIGPAVSGAVALAVPVSAVIALSGGVAAVLGVLLVGRALAVPLKQEPGPPAPTSCSGTGNGQPATRAPIEMDDPSLIRTPRPMETK
ncbi:Predicted arabinose efflux permease, MFS family [Nonomuraea solani]|uniref:Predicted arabinose efflux permease, MFS family n=1 Tax=Nonomuraea solani TaxID=1144553 RepID=A0A1H6F3F8_9ACTN|nr:MFS transporter [Nonomuraea solani]SEH03484.1 Predicted arabinose efflux permease, MFS family [Nonomuraea solani]